MSQSIDRLLKKIEENVDKEIDVMALELNQIFSQFPIVFILILCFNLKHV